MAHVPVPAYQQFFKDKRSWLKTEYKAIINTHPMHSINAAIIQVVVCYEGLDSYTLVSVVESEEWAAEDNRHSYCKALQGKHYSAHCMELIQ
jgi:hypothetical protein